MAAELLFQCCYQLDALHGIEPEIKFKIGVWPNRCRFGFVCIADHGECTLYLWLLQPCGIIIAQWLFGWGFRACVFLRMVCPDKFFNLKAFDLARGSPRQ